MKLVSTVLKHVDDESRDNWRVLEPCAGNGSLITAVNRQMSQKKLQVTAYELDPALCEENEWTHADFLTTTPTEHEFVLCNPPFNEEREDGGNGSRGRDLPLLFLVHAAKFAPLLGFIMHQNKGCNTFQEKVAAKCPDLALVERFCVAKDISVFSFQHKRKNIPTSIYIYKRGGISAFPPKTFSSEECALFKFVDLNDARTNCIIKRWGSPNRVGRFVSSEPNDIALEISKQRSTYTYCSGVNFNLHVEDLVLFKTQLTTMEPLLREHFSYARDCPNVSITKPQFITIFLRSHA